MQRRISPDSACAAGALKQWSVPFDRMAALAVFAGQGFTPMNNSSVRKSGGRLIAEESRDAFPALGRSFRWAASGMLVNASEPARAM